jgi:hypothetical protein
VAGDPLSVRAGSSREGITRCKGATIADHGAMSELSLPSEVKRKWDLEAVRAAFDPIRKSAACSGA